MTPQHLTYRQSQLNDHTTSYLNTNATTFKKRTTSTTTNQHHIHYTATFIGPPTKSQPFSYLKNKTLTPQQSSTTIATY